MVQTTGFRPKRQGDWSVEGRPAWFGSALAFPRMPVVRFARSVESPVLPDTLTAELQCGGHRVKMIGPRHPTVSVTGYSPYVYGHTKRAVIGSCYGGKVGRWKKGCATEHSGYLA